MILTNKYNLAPELYEGIKRWFFEKENPNPPHFRVTELIRPIQQVVLQRHHYNDAEVDVMDIMNAFEGSATHEFLHKFGDVDALQEELVEVEVAGYKLRGVPDYYKNRKIADWKKCSVWSYINRSNIKEWTDQLNFYAFMYESLGFPVNSLEIIALFKDWSATKARFGDDYPKTRSVVVPLERYSLDKTREMLENRITSLATHLKEYPTMPLPQCTPEERWEKPTVYAVMKEGRKSAVKLHETEDAMLNHIRELGKKHYPEIRPGERTRCLDWCSAAPFCSQWQTYLKENHVEV